MEDIALRHVTFTDSRGTGQTYRLVLRAIMFASERPGFRCVIVMQNMAELNHAMEMARAIVMPLRDFAYAHRTRRKVALNNGSEVMFIPADRDSASLRGLTVHDFAVDPLARITEELRDWLLVAVRPYSKPT